MFLAKLSSKKWCQLLAITGVGILATTSVQAQNYSPNSSNNVTRVITDFNGYWSSTNVNTPRPNNRHNVLGFENNGVVYSTGVNDAILTANGVNFTPAQFRAFSFPSIGGNISGSSIFLVAGSEIDGNPTASVHTASTIANLTIKDVLTDGIRGLDIGTGVTNIANSTPMLMDVSISNAATLDDAVPDIFVSQIAQAMNSDFDVIDFIDVNGIRVGNAVNLNFMNMSNVGRYNTDFFVMPQGQPYDTAKPTSSTLIGELYREISLIGIKLSSFGITAANMAQVAKVRIVKGSSADPAFYAYNEASISTGDLPQITQNPVSLTTCIDGSQSATFTVNATGNNLEYQWRLNGVDIPGATAASYTVSNVTAAHSGEYTVWVRNTNGSVQSSIAYLNLLFASPIPNRAICSSATSTLSTSIVGLQASYQWYSNTTNSTTGGVAIAGATSTTLTFPATTAGTYYYYVKVNSVGLACNEISSNVATVVVNQSNVGGSATASSTTICSGNSVNLSLTGSQGTIRWQYALATTPNTWVNLTGTGSTTTAMTVPAVTSSRRFRAALTSPNCTTAYSSIVTVTVNQTNTWTGAVDANWSDAGNWSCGIVPTATHNVEIPALASLVYPQSTSAQVANLTVAATAQLTVVGTLAVSGAVTANGILDLEAATLEFTGTDQQVTGEILVNRVVKTTAGTVTLNNEMYVKEAVEFSNGTLASAGNLVFGSSENQTAIAQLSGSGIITGDVTTERYLGPRRSYRHLATSVNGANIFQNWQENGTASAGYGIFITGSASTAGGFDATPQNSPSLFNINPATGSFVEVANTNATNLEAGKGYRVFVRGDRTINLSSNSAVPTLTRLRAKGTLFTANHTVTDLNQNLNGWSLVGNPYQNQVNLRQALVDGSGLNSNYAWVWDPYMNTRGGYVIVDLVNNTNNVVGSQAGSTLLVGESVMLRTIAASPTLAFNSTHWTNGVIEPSIMSEPVANMRFTLFADGGTQALDGLVINYGTGFDSGIDAKDANKLSNQDETIAVRQNERNYGIQYRSIPEVEERIAMYHANYRHANYTYQIELNQYDGPQAYWFDAVNQTYTALQDGMNTISFAAMENEPSPRFEIVFEPNILSVGEFATSQVRVYPNPVKEQRFTVNHPEGEVQQVELFNMLGQSVGIVKQAVSSTSLEIKPNGQWSTGVYTLVVTIDAKQIQTQLIID